MNSNISFSKLVQTLTQSYLYINAFLYFVFAVWCLIKLYGTSKFLGYQFVNDFGKVEYIAVYGGMQLGFSIFFIIMAYYPSFHTAGLIFSVAIYACIVILRTSSALYFGNIQKTTYIVGALEYCLCILGIILLVNNFKNISLTQS